MGAGRILIIEDEAPIRRFLRVVLEAHDFEVCESATGRDGIGRSATASPDIVILDLGLPDIDGNEVVTRLREWSPLLLLVLSVPFGSESCRERVCHSV